MMGYHYTAVGDSLTYGIGAFPGSGFVSLYRRMSEACLQQGVYCDNLGVNGLTSAGLHERIMRDHVMRESLRAADIITLSAGGNDLIRTARSAGGHPGRYELDQAMHRCQHNIHQCISEIHRLKAGGGRPYMIRAVGLYNPYPYWEEAGIYVERFNGFLGSLDGWGSFRTAFVSSRFHGREQEMLSFDGLHPNYRGHRVIAEQLCRLGYKPLA